MYVLSDGDTKNPEVEVSGKSEELYQLGIKLSGVTNNCVIESCETVNEFYPVSLKGIKIMLEKSEISGDLLDVQVKEQFLSIRGGLKAFNKLGDSLINYFNPKNNPADDHFQLDYFEGNDILAPTTICLIFQSHE